MTIIRLDHRDIKTYLLSGLGIYWIENGELKV